MGRHQFQHCWRLFGHGFSPDRALNGIRGLPDLIYARPCRNGTRLMAGFRPPGASLGPIRRPCLIAVGRAPMGES